MVLRQRAPLRHGLFTHSLISISHVWPEGENKKKFIVLLGNYILTDYTHIQPNNQKKKNTCWKNVYLAILQGRCRRSFDNLPTPYIFHHFYMAWDCRGPVESHNFPLVWPKKTNIDWITLALHRSSFEYLTACNKISTTVSVTAKHNFKSNTIFFKFQFPFHFLIHFHDILAKQERPSCFLLLFVHRQETGHGGSGTSARSSVRVSALH